MAAIARRAVLALFATSFAATADQPRDVLQVIHYVASALADGNPSDAMVPFDKSFSKYAKLRDYFDGLTNAFQISSEVDVTEEQDSDQNTNLTLQWQLTLTDRANNANIHRSAEIHAQVRRVNGKWKIVDFTPVDFFSPDFSSTSARAESQPPRRSHLA